MNDQKSTISALPISHLLFFAIVLGVVFAIGNPMLGNAQETTKQAHPPIEFSTNTNKACLIYDAIGSLRLRPRTDKQRESTIKDPRLQIFPDGRVKTGKAYKKPSVEGQISEKRLMELMEFAVNKASIYELESTTIKSQLQGLGSRSHSATLFRVLLERGGHELVVQSLGSEAEAAGATDTLKRIHELETRCDQIYKEVQLGTKENQAKILALVNTELNEQFPDIAPFTLNEILLVGQTPEGKFSSVFKRVLANEKTKGNVQLLGAVSRESKTADYTVKVSKHPDHRSTK